VAKALAAVDATSARQGPFDSMVLQHLLWKLTGDRSRLERARERLDALLSKAPPDRREAMQENVKLHRAIRADGEAAAN
jgi:hypothetical protein